MCFSREHIHEPRVQRVPAAPVRPAAAAVPVPRAHRPVGGGAHVAVADRLSTARLSAVRVGQVAVPERADRRAGRHTHHADVGHAAGHRRAGAHRLQVRPRLTRARGPRADGLRQRDRAQPRVDGPGHQGGVGRVIEPRPPRSSSSPALIPSRCPNTVPVPRDVIT